MRPATSRRICTNRATNSSGSHALRQAIAERYCERGLPTEPDEVMVTTGALHAIGLILTTYVQPGDRVLVEQPTYHGALSAITTAGARPVPVAMTEDGWELDAVHAAVHQLCAEPGLPDSRQPEPDRADHARCATGNGWRASSPRREPAPSSTRPSSTCGWTSRCPTPMAADDDDATRPGADDRFDVEVVLGRAARRLDPRRARHHRHHRRAAPVDRHGHAGARTVRRRKASRAARRDTARTPRDPAGPAGVAAVAAEPPSARLGARARASAACRCGCACPRR